MPSQSALHYEQQTKKTTATTKSNKDTLSLIEHVLNISVQCGAGSAGKDITTRRVGMALAAGCRQSAQNPWLL